MNVPSDIRSMFRPRPTDAHKGTMGHALLVAGSKGMAGAALLSARACLRSGVGKLSVLTPDCNRPILQLGVPEAIVATEATVHPTNYDAVAVGPGLGQSPEAAELLHSLLSEARQPLVLDADALNLLAIHPEWWPLVPAESILTPHPGEVARLTGPWTDRSQCICHCQQLATERHLTVVCKGGPTVVCLSDGQLTTNETGNPGMATAGAGDVLTGIIVALLARGYAPREAARMGVWLHGAAGDSAAQLLGQESLVASDLVAHLPQAFKELSK